MGPGSLEVGNYRPVTIQIVLNKIFKKLMAAQGTESLPNILVIISPHTGNAMTVQQRSRC